jgi:unsaturated rhamnogalacturonyl hydrolase
MKVSILQRLEVTGRFFFLATGTLLVVCAIVLFLPCFSQEHKIQKTLKLVADWQLGHMTGGPHPDSEEVGWAQAAFYIGLARLAVTSNDRRYFEAIWQLGQRNDWDLGPRPYHADDQAVGQVYVAAFDHYHDSRTIARVVARFDRVLANRPNEALIFDQANQCQRRWCWCDALFMAPPTWMAASRITGDRRYREYADSEFWATKDFLFDRDEHLFYRDSRFFDQRGPEGEKIFWGRGNGWVFAGLINILAELPRDHPNRPRYEALFIEMAETLLTRQRSDGFWSTSLMSPPDSSMAEASGSAFFTYGMASGVTIGLLDRKRFATAAMRGWKALAGAIDSDGRLGRVQQIADGPGPVDVNGSQFYGSGALLLAGTAVKAMLASQ